MATIKNESGFGDPGTSIRGDDYGKLSQTISVGVYMDFFSHQYCIHRIYSLIFKILSSIPDQILVAQLVEVKLIRVSIAYDDHRLTVQ